MNTGRIFRLILMLFLSTGFITQSNAGSSVEKSDIDSEYSVLAQKEVHQRELIVLIHGLMRTSMSMSFLKSYLENQGYQVYSYSYPSAKYGIREHGIYLKRYIVNLIANNPGVKIHFITHSLGGIISREAIAVLTKNQLQHIGYLIMMAPPNQGSFLAKISTKFFPWFTSPIKPLAELSSDKSSYVHHVPVPKIKMGIIAGRYDAKVPPSSATLNGKADLVVINSTHTFIMSNFESEKLILNFLENGTFDER
jgi:hypothetical protein